MKYIQSELSRELRSKYSALTNDNSTGLDVAFQNMRIRAIRKNAEIDSFRIEHPELRVPFSVPRNHKRKMIKNGVKNLENAFKWGRSNFDSSNFNEEFIRELAGKITPELYEGRIAQYRTTGTQITGSSVTPPYPSKFREIEIPKFVNCMRSKLQSEDVIDRIESAIFAHMHIARMHPFIDGNGRTARTLQYILLDNMRIPPPIIEVGERNTYYSLLDGAVYDWKHEREQGTKKGVSHGEQLFYDFIAGKINISLDKVICHRC